MSELPTPEQYTDALAVLASTGLTMEQFASAVSAPIVLTEVDLVEYLAMLGDMPVEQVTEMIEGVTEAFADSPSDPAA